MFPSTMLDLLQWSGGLEVVQQILDQYNESQPDGRPLLYNASSTRLLPPIDRPGKIVALGINYRDHAEETEIALPEFPVVFSKFPSAVIGPGDDIVIPKVSNKIDWEVELGVVIGQTCKAVEFKDALDYVAGYTVLNDVTARDIQMGDGQWVRGKSLDTFCPMGPCIVTADELGDASGLKMHTKVNGTIKQDSSTSNLVFDVPHIISHLSQSFSLEPGDVIATGTPAGVGFTRKPPEYLKHGDEVEAYVEDIGNLKNKVV